MGCIVHYIHKKKLKSHILFLLRSWKSPHTSEHIKVCFEDELDNYGISCFMVVTDNAANMKNAFLMINDDSDDVDVEKDDDEDEEAKVNNTEAMDTASFEVLISCAAHQIQLVVNNGYKELKSYH